ncbi:hypothetical protein EASAB2608_04343 [Streptomyces sp. EAS-AB2608]|nr:hypothetical protein EASAB2608_04343 [Streptomyces sp. EAS-AB2608]
MRRRTHAERAAARAAARDDFFRIIDRYEGGQTVRRIAGDYGVSESWLRDRLDEWGVPRRPRHQAHLHRRPAGHVFRGRIMKRRTRAEVEAAQNNFISNRDSVITRYRAGASAASLAREFAVAPKWVGEQLENWGVPRRDRSAAAIVRGPGVPPL